VLELRFPLELEIVLRVVDDLVEGRGFGGTSPVVLERLLCFLQRVTPEPTGLFGEARLAGVLKLEMSADRGSGQDSGRAMRLRLPRLYVRVGTPDLLVDVQLTPTPSLYTVCSVLGVADILQECKCLSLSL